MTAKEGRGDNTGALEAIVVTGERLTHGTRVVELDGLDGGIQAGAEQHEADDEDDDVKDGEEGAEDAGEEAAAVEVEVGNGPLCVSR